LADEGVEAYWEENVQEHLDRLKSLAERETDASLRRLIRDAHRRLHQQMRDCAAATDHAGKFSLKAEQCRLIAEWCDDPSQKDAYANLARSYDRMAGNAKRNTEEPF
jgi:hypothetical protein